MTNRTRERPSKKFSHQGRVDAEFGNVYQHLAKADLGEFRFYPSSISTVPCLYLQVWSVASNKWVSIIRFDLDGSIHADGSVNALSALSDEGNG